MELPTMSHKLKQWLMSFPPEVRDVLITKNTGTSMAYVLKRLYLHEDPDTLPTFKAKIAIGLDKASRGKLDFRSMLEDGSEIDWAYVRSALNKRGVAPASEKQLTATEQPE
jgi:hypothetical protein